MVEALNPSPGKAPTRVRKRFYDAYRTAILKAVPRSDRGVEFRALMDLVCARLPDEIRAETRAMWWVTTVKLDLEARGLIERVPGASPQRLRRCGPRVRATMRP
jgi:hypothetical protein